ncbi:MAG: branched-chain amino acid ABC transporter permease, partial [Bdellovibrionales bacterium]|nr:branched-chain amino acid ABC transporter permease [Bdellovibrionales bacterium]
TSVVIIFTIGSLYFISLCSIKVCVSPFLKYNTFLVLVTTLALGMVFEGIVSLLFGVQVESLPATEWNTSIDWNGLYITPLQVFIISITIISVCTLAYLMHSSSIGRKIRAISEHPSAAQALGANYTLATELSFVIGALMAGTAGVLIGFDTSLQPTMGTVYTIKAFAAMMLGGLGNIWGAIIGAYLLGLVENISIGLDLGAYSIPAGYRDSFAFLLIVGVLIIRPQGLFGEKVRKS